MARPARRSKGKKIHQIHWDSEDWRRILQAAAVRAVEAELRQVTPTDVIRTGTARYVAELLGDEQKAS